jgi:hypothetical protein
VELDALMITVVHAASWTSMRIPLENITEDAQSSCQTTQGVGI